MSIVKETLVYDDEKIAALSLRPAKKLKKKFLENPKNGTAIIYGYGLFGTGDGGLRNNEHEDEMVKMIELGEAIAKHEACEETVEYYGWHEMVMFESSFFEVQAAVAEMARHFEGIYFCKEHGKNGLEFSVRVDNKAFKGKMPE